MNAPLTTLRPHAESPLPWSVTPEPSVIEDYEGNTFAEITAADGMSVATSLWIEDAQFIVALVNAAFPMAAQEHAQQLDWQAPRPDPELRERVEHETEHDRTETTEHYRDAMMDSGRGSLLR